MLILTFIATASAVALVILPIPWVDLVAGFTIYSDDPNLTLRIDAAQLAIRRIGDFPLFGVPAAVFNADRVGVHQIMGYFAVMFGLPAGLACTWLLLVSVWASRVPPGRRTASGGPVRTLVGGVSAGECNMSALLMGAVLGMGLTNNFAASMLYWSAWAISCMPWTFAVKAPAGVVSGGVWRTKQREGVCLGAAPSRRGEAIKNMAEIIDEPL